MNHIATNLLKDQTDEAWKNLTDRLESMTDDEFFWEPVPNCWTVHPGENGRWIVDYVGPAPDPPPFTTIGWRLVHIAACKWMYYEYAFGPAKLTWDDLDIPHTTTDAIAWLTDGHKLLRKALDIMDDAGLSEMRLTNWGDSWPTWRIFWTMILHDLHHGAEIGCLRDLYRASQHK
ncbi:MAG TPA: DinB family protein [Anaerolineae bacterium]|nr:DinB family protein [Anaerolineae bacterium]